MEENLTKTIGSDSLYTDYNKDGTLNCKGLTKREYFASMALQGLLSNSKMLTEHENMRTIFDYLIPLSIKCAEKFIGDLNA